MRVDHATLSDLAIMDSDLEGSSLFALLDRTATRIGKGLLRRRMRELPDSARELRAIQDAVRYLASTREAPRRIIEALNPDAIDAYLGLRWQTVIARTAVTRLAERMVLRLRYRDAVRQVRDGVLALRAFVDGLPSMIETLASAPALLSHYAEELAAVRDQDVMREIRHHASHTSLRHMLEADRVARGPASSAIRRCVGILAELDVLSALASATTEHGWTLPEIVDVPGVVELHELRHPFMPLGSRNDVIVDNRQRVLALTGPNMAGKSTTLKAVGTAVYLAHLGCGVPASRARISWFEVMMSSLMIRDSIARGESYYLSEVRRIRDLVRTLETSPRVFAILDEPFKGTNVHDASDATTLLLDGLCAQQESTVIVATHLASVVRSREHDPALVTAHLRAVEGPSGPEFDYLLQRGISEQRLGMVLLEREGVTAALLHAIERRRPHVPVA
jgi:DNA mismatch repair ATPase MutS